MLQRTTMEDDVNVGEYINMSLTEKELIVSGTSKIWLDDIAGCHVGYGDDSSENNDVVVENFPLIKNRRAYQQIRMKLPSRDDAQRLYQCLSSKIRRKLAPHLLQKVPCNRVLLLINPFSGQRRAKELWAKYGKYVLQAAGIEVNIINTEYVRHATKIIQELDIDLYDAVLVDGGDGLVTETICGLLMRKDRERALKLPICHIPGGTSNALAAAICYACNEPFSSRGIFITECCLMVTRPRYLPLRIYVVDTEYDGTRPMFMSATWGLIADIDLGSERFRWAGMIRLHMEAILRILQLPTVATYRARLSYIPVNCKMISRNTMLKYNCKRNRFGKGHFKFNTVEQTNGWEQILNEDFSSMKDALEGTTTMNMPPLDQPLNEKWKVVEGDWVMANVSTLSHLGSDIPFLPSARLDESVMYLTLIDWNTIKSRLHIAHLFSFMQSSKHFDHPCFQVIPVKAVRVEPLSDGGHFAIDGEPCRSGSSFQVVPTKYCATVIGRKEVVQRN
ncbi:diacylglycerol kinase catalytic domain protein [Dictyocaulus viviparus]|uniref:Diacylglycerol kinase catalytic domain protein n=1 Tax=Dictyocaulus viviparus TaxID=29172 RepID=A0A0D8XQC2_DICVI|nr:diacylglycerol kinase catalytic domain protein [Dictyocaulus viviparus]